MSAPASNAVMVAKALRVLADRAEREIPRVGDWYAARLREQAESLIDFDADGRAA